MEQNETRGEVSEQIGSVLYVMESLLCCGYCANEEVFIGEDGKFLGMQ